MKKGGCHQVPMVADVMNNYKSYISSVLCYEKFFKLKRRSVYKKLIFIRILIFFWLFLNEFSKVKSNFEALIFSALTTKEEAKSLILLEPFYQDGGGHLGF